MANSIYEKYLKYLVHCCCHLEALGLVGQKPLISHMVEKGKYAYLVVISDILMFYDLKKNVKILRESVKSWRRNLI